MARVLIAEDDEGDRLLLGTILEEAGHELYFAANGEEALKMSASRASTSSAIGAARRVAKFT